MKIYERISELHNHIRIDGEIEAKINHEIWLLLTEHIKEHTSRKVVCFLKKIEEIIELKIFEEVEFQIVEKIENEIISKK